MPCLIGSLILPLDIFMFVSNSTKFYCHLIYFKIKYLLYYIFKNKYLNVLTVFFWARKINTFLAQNADVLLY